MATTLRVLILEDNPSDAELALYALRQHGYDPISNRVETEPDYREQIQRLPEIILADYSMPEFDSLRALEILQECQLDIPFIIVSGTIGEDGAVRVMQRGATDYIIKDRLGRLGLAVEQALACGRLKEEKLKAEQTIARLAAIVETSGDAIIATTLDGVITSWNRAAENLYGYSALEILGQPMSILLPQGRRLSDTPENAPGDLERVGNGDHIPAFESVRVRKDGRRIEVLLSISPIRDSKGLVIGASAFALDITLRKRSERFLNVEQVVTGILTESKDLDQAGPQVLKTIATSLRWELAVLWTIDRKSNVLRATHHWHASWADADFVKALCNRTVLERGTGVAGRAWKTGEAVWEKGIIIETLTHGISTITGEGLRGGFALPMRRGAELVGIIEFYNPEMQEPDAALIAALDNIASKISQFCERRRTEAALRASEERYRTLITATTAIVWDTPESGEFETEQPGWKAFTGQTFEQYIGWGWLNAVHPDDRARTAEAWTAAWKEGRVYEMEHRIRRADGEFRQMFVRGVPVLEPGGAVREWVGVHTDVTEQKSLLAQFQQAQKMEAFGQLAGGVAHDFNNLLTIISGYSEILLSQLPLENPMRASVKCIGEAGDRAASLTRQLLAFSRKSILEPRILDLDQVVRETEQLLRRLIGEDVLLTVLLDPNLSRIKIDPGQMGQVLINLAVNARDAMPQGGKLTIETSNVHLDAAYAEKHQECRPGPYVKLTVSDNGCGMTAATKEHVFEPFFTTKGPGKGTGLGLATVHGIIQQSGGSVDLFSEVGQGTIFKIYLPAVDEPFHSATHLPLDTIVTGGTETILLVEDEAAVRAIAVLSLQNHGYTLLQADCGATALEIIESHHGPLDVLVTDVVMPGLSGRELVETLQDRFPNLKVLYTSGYTDDAVIRHGILQVEVAFLEKPYKPLALARKVREVLDWQTAGIPADVGVM